MPRTEIKHHWLLGSRLVTVYTDNDRMLQKLGRKLGIDLLKLGPNVTKVLVEDGEVKEVQFILNRRKRASVHIGIAMEHTQQIGNVCRSYDGGETWRELALFSTDYPDVDWIYQRIINVFNG